MTHKYTISGMSCNGCKSKVEKALNEIDGIEATVSLETNSASITMEKHIPISKFQEVLSSIGNYSISDFDEEKSKNSDKKILDKDNKTVSSNNDSASKYHCPMHCEGDKNYNKAGDCPVCGMNLEKVHDVENSKSLYTCPMHPEIIKEHSGSCPICGMDLVPMNPSDSEEQKTYKDLVKKMKVAVVFTVPVFAIAMIEMIPNNPLLKIMDASKWNFVQLILTLPV
ncbi:heavy metal-binding domain-containing protein, partial [Flavobacterium sp.]|uniref:heavy metal-binding domain-containing protein n=1 Tax=Flavobacterium sp. TaxID=239 RepID=UPI0037537694